jgi:hypothetical protein
LNPAGRVEVHAALRTVVGPLNKLLPFRVSVPVPDLVRMLNPFSPKVTVDHERSRGAQARANVLKPVWIVIRA